MSSRRGWRADGMVGFWFFLLTLSATYRTAFTSRHLETMFNPFCDDECKDPGKSTPNLVYTRSEGPEDTLHHLWSTVAGAPSLLLVQTSPTANLSVNWTLLMNPDLPGEAIHFTEDPNYALAVVFTKLVQYRDVDDDGSMNDRSQNVTLVDMGNFFWQNASETEFEHNADFSSATFRTVLNSSDAFFREKNGSLSFQLETHGEEGRSESIPRLLYSGNSSQVRLTLDKVLSTFDTSRFAVEVVVLATENDTDVQGDSPFTVQTIKSMDDEYTPGVFKNVHVLSEGSRTSSFGAYLSWKPVAYTSNELSVTGSTNAVHYPSAANYTLHNVTDSLAKIFFAGQLFHRDVSISAFNVSFGTSKDDFYLNSNYSQWTMSYGLGVPGEEKVSQLVMIVMASGLGLPLLLIIASSVYLGYQRFRVQKDDLLLSGRR